MSRPDTETHCHCSADYRGSDHCPECGCERYESGDCGHNFTPNGPSYPYNAGDRVMLGICTWQHPLRYDPVLDAMEARGASLYERADREREQGPVHGPSGPLTRYFIAATVIANDRQDGILVIRTDDNGRYDELRYDDFNGDEVVPECPALPQTAADAHACALRGEIY